jgi:hypothetical protein
VRNYYGRTAIVWSNLFVLSRPVTFSLSIPLPASLLQPIQYPLLGEEEGWSRGSSPHKEGMWRKEESNILDRTIVMLLLQ